MTRDIFWKQFSALPPTSKKLVEELVSALGAGVDESASTSLATLTKPRSKKLSSQPFVGMWRDREEMTDSTAWVRHQRQQEWSRSGG